MIVRFIVGGCKWFSNNQFRAKREIVVPTYFLEQKTRFAEEPATETGYGRSEPKVGSLQEWRVDPDTL